MSSISSNFLNPLRSPTDAAEALKDPGEALRRLDLPGPAARDWQEVIRLDSLGVANVARAIDGERQALERALARAGDADKALEKIVELLKEADTLATGSAKPGASRNQRKKSQKRLDAILEEVDQIAADTGPAGAKVFDGNMTLLAGSESLKIDRVALDSLGKLTAGGRTVRLEDVRTRGPLDTGRRRGSAAVIARRSIAQSTDTVDALRKRVQTFQRDALRPRLGDVATAMEGLYDATAGTLTSGEDALATARNLRQMMLAGVTIATAVQAEGWDRERVLALLT